jgi:hypothetical protein
MQNAKCRMQNGGFYAKCKMQNAKCRMADLKEKSAILL